MLIVPPDEELDEACAAVGILDYVRRQPMGYDAPVGESGASLSGGQRQRFSVAQVVLKKGKMWEFIFCDRNSEFTILRMPCV